VSESDEKVKNKDESSGVEYYNNVSEEVAACPTPLENPEFQGPTPQNLEKAECSNPVPAVFQRSNPEVSLVCTYGQHEACSGKFNSFQIDRFNKTASPLEITCTCPCHASNTAPEVT
jgi:hypothetical protein